MDKYIKLSELYRIADKYGLKRDIRAKEEIQECAVDVPDYNVGKWVRCGDHHLCSECGEWSLTRWDGDECDYVDVLTDFCPDCGADMRGGKAIHE